MITAYLLFSRETDLGPVHRFLETRPGVTRLNAPAGGVVYRDLTGAETAFATVEHGRAGVYVALPLPSAEAVALDVATLVRVRALRLLATGEDARRLALYSWWGPDLDGTPSERMSTAVGLVVRSRYHSEHVSDGIPPVPVAVLEADCIASRRPSLDAPALAAVFAQLRRATAQGEPGADPLEAVFGAAARWRAPHPPRRWSACEGRADQNSL
ncbi:MAG TPA: hypothetical protein VF178_01685 [Gemmatimonadaceae bacterium]